MHDDVEPAGALSMCATAFVTAAGSATSQTSEWVALGRRGARAVEAVHVGAALAQARADGGADAAAAARDDGDAVLETEQGRLRRS